MASQEEIRSGRIHKIEILKENGLDPYPIESGRTLTLKNVVDNFENFSNTKNLVTLAGRIMAVRGHGGVVFLDIIDGEGKIQVCMKRDDIGEKSFSLFSETVDIGDFIETSGTLFLTKREEKTLLASSWRMLSKSLRALPDKWHGLHDIDERFRKRYLDLLMSPEVKNRFLVVSRINTAIRKFLDAEGYLEVDTPILQPLAGGATAKPFVTHHNALDIDLYLRIAPELYHKMLLIGGIPKVYEICRNFRNEGIDVTHNPEFTELEFYESFSNAKDQMERTERLIKFVVKESIGKDVIGHDLGDVDFSKPFDTTTYLNLLEECAGIKSLVVNKDMSGLTKRAKDLSIEVKPSDSWDKVVDNIYKKVCRPKLIQPTFIVDYPVEFSPFAKRIPGRREFIDRFQLVIAATEVVNAFSELNDPQDQKERFLEQEEKRQRGEEEVSPMDEDYIEALEYGLPPAGGVGLGINRLAMILTNTHNIKEVILFPTMKPRELP